MSRTKSITVVSLLILIALGGASFGSSQTATSNNAAHTTQSENADTMRALLDEVRQLRLAIQRSNISGYQAQVILERVRLQQRQTDRLAERLRETRDRIGGLKMRRIELQWELKNIEGRVSRDNRKPYPQEEELLENLNTRVEVLTQEDARARELEQQLVAQLPIEQARLAELNDQLDALQRELEIPAVEKKTQDGKRP